MKRRADPPKKLSGLLPHPDPRAVEEMVVFDNMPPEWRALVHEFGVSAAEYKTCKIMGMSAASARAHLVQNGAH